MPTLKLLLIVPILFISILSASEIEDDYLEITYHSISNNDTVQINSGLALSFSEPIDLESFNAESMTYMSYYYEDEYHTDSSKIFIQNSQNITLNGAPLSFWYDSETYSCAFLNETTETDPDGTGLGFPIDVSNVFIIQNVASYNGSIMNSDFELTFYKVDEGGYNVVPNPFIYPAVWQPDPEPLIFFRYLPTICSIYIFSINGDTINYIEHNSELTDGTENWSLEDMDGNTINSGIYLWGIETNEFNNFKNGVLFTVLPDMELSLISDRSFPFEFSLINNFPNPFNSSTTIEFSIPNHSYIQLSIFDVLGQEVETILDKELSSGKYSFTWNGNNLPSGVYFIRLSNNQTIRTRKVVLIK